MVERHFIKNAIKLMCTFPLCTTAERARERKKRHRTSLSRIQHKEQNEIYTKFISINTPIACVDGSWMWVQAILFDRLNNIVYPCFYLCTQFQPKWNEIYILQSRENSKYTKYVLAFGIVSVFFPIHMKIGCAIEIKIIVIIIIRFHCPHHY